MIQETHSQLFMDHKTQKLLLQLGLVLFVWAIQWRRTVVILFMNQGPIRSRHRSFSERLMTREAFRLERLIVVAYRVFWRLEAYTSDEAIVPRSLHSLEKVRALSTRLVGRVVSQHSVPVVEKREWQRSRDRALKLCVNCSS